MASAAALYCGAAAACSRLSCRASGRDRRNRMNVVRHVVIHGRVQGVGYRMWTEALAEGVAVEGWGRDRRDGTVEPVFAGPEQAVTAAIEAGRGGPRGAHVETVDVEEGDASLLQQREGPRFAVLRTA